MILGFLSIYAYTLCRRTTKFDVVTYVGEGRVLASPSIPNSGVPVLPNFGDSPVFMPTPFFNTERPNSTW